MTDAPSPEVHTKAAEAAATLEGAALASASVTTVAAPRSFLPATQPAARFAPAAAAAAEPTDGATGCGSTDPGTAAGQVAPWPLVAGYVRRRTSLRTGSAAGPKYLETCGVICHLPPSTGPHLLLVLLLQPQGATTPARFRKHGDFHPP